MISENPLLLNMGDSDTAPGPSSSSSSSPPFSSNTSLPMLYYGLVVVGTAAIALAIYNIIVIRWCTQRHENSTRRRTRLAEMPASHSYENQSRNLLSSFKYKKGSISMGSEDGGGYECSVCLSVFQDGDEVKQLPRCKHSFHAPCIDMWLYSHFDCPLCRTSVDPHPSTISQRQREGYPGIPVLV